MIPHGDLTPDWCDPVAVWRALNGMTVGRPLHLAEQREVARIGVSGGRSYNVIARLLGCRQDRAERLETECKETT